MVLAMMVGTATFVGAKAHVEVAECQRHHACHLADGTDRCRQAVQPHNSARV